MKSIFIAVFVFFCGFVLSSTFKVEGEDVDVSAGDNSGANSGAVDIIIQTTVNTTGDISEMEPLASPSSAQSICKTNVGSLKLKKRRIKGGIKGNTATESSGAIGGGAPDYATYLRRIDESMK